MADMEQRVELNYLMDFYGPLLTEHRRELMRLYCEEDLTLAEIADQMDITRQGVSDALNKAPAGRLRTEAGSGGAVSRADRAGTAVSGGAGGDPHGRPRAHAPRETGA